MTKKVGYVATGLQERFRKKIPTEYSAAIVLLSISQFCARLLPKKIVREPFGLPTLKVSSPSHFFKSQEFEPRICSSWDHIYNKVRMNHIRRPFGLRVQKFQLR